MELVLKPYLSNLDPEKSILLHVCILCGALKHSLGSARSMSFVKLSYLFDSVLRKKFDSHKRHSLLKPWDLEGYFRKALLIANDSGYIKLTSKPEGLAVSLDTEGIKLLEQAEKIGAFNIYFEALKNNKYTESDFKKPELRCDINEYQ